MEYTEDDITSNMGLVYHVAKRMRHLERSGVMEFEDLINEGVVGLIFALDRFDESKGFKFSCYACKCISGYMLRGHRSLHMEQWKAMQSRYDVPSTKISMYQTWLDSDEVKEVVGCDDRGMGACAMFDAVNNRCVWDHLLPLLSPRQRQMMEMSFQDVTQEQIAIDLGVTRQCVSQTMKLAIKRAKSFFAVEEVCQ